MSEPFEQAERSAPKRRTQDKLRELNVKQVAALKAHKWHRVSEGLYLAVSATSRRWVHQYMASGKRHELWLGRDDAVTLDQARDKVVDARRLVAAGKCPIAERNKVAPAAHPFRDVTKLWIKKQTPSWTNKKYGAQVSRYLDTYVMPKLGKLDVAVIDTPAVMSVLEPIWYTINPTAVCIRGYVESILGYAKAMKWRTGENPAVWKENLQFLLAAPSDVHKSEEHPSIHHSEIAEFMAVLRSIDGDRTIMEMQKGKPVPQQVPVRAFRALEMTILSALRSEEARDARWPELDLAAAKWSLPDTRMKERVPHTVPLPPYMVEIFNAQPRATSDRVFGVMSDARLRHAMRAVEDAAGKVWLDKQTGKRANIHGFRASFTTWGADAGYDPVLVDVALAHAQGTEVNRRYQRSDMIERRRALMVAWAQHCAGIANDDALTAVAA